MRDRPEGVRETALVSALADGWGIDARSTGYLPAGAGSYHWTVLDDGGRRWIVNVDDLGTGAGPREAAFDRLGRAFATASALRRDARLDFVLAPIPTRTGAPVRRLDPRYAVSVCPMVPGEAGGFGPHPPRDRAEMVRLLVELHRATPVVAPHASRTDLRLPGRDRLHDALTNLGQEWPGGPFAGPARQLLAARAGRVEQLLGEFDRLVERVRGTGEHWVITHGEPHPANVIRSPDGLRLIDWDTVQIAPPERDLWLVVGDSDDLLAGYARATGRPVDAAALALYRLWWKLADIAIYLDLLRRPHRATGDITAAWGHLNRYLE